MRNSAFRVVAVILGILFIVGAFPISEYAPDEFWPSWIHPIAFLLLGTSFLVFGISGRTWPRSYNRKVFENDDDLSDG